MPKIILPSVAPQLQEPITRQKTKKNPLTRERVVLYPKMRLNVLNLYDPNDLELQNRSLKIADKADLTLLQYLSH
jgi:hypothetical protein